MNGNSDQDQGAADYAGEEDALRGLVPACPGRGLRAPWVLHCQPSTGWAAKGGTRWPPERPGLLAARPEPREGPSQESQAVWGWASPRSHGVTVQVPDVTRRPAIQTQVETFGPSWSEGLPDGALNCPGGRGQPRAAGRGRQRPPGQRPARAGVAAAQGLGHSAEPGHARDTGGTSPARTRDKQLSLMPSFRALLNPGSRSRCQGPEFAPEEIPLPCCVTQGRHRGLGCSSVPRPQSSPHPRERRARNLPVLGQGGHLC